MRESFLQCIEFMEGTGCLTVYNFLNFLVKSVLNELVHVALHLFLRIPGSFTLSSKKVSISITATYLVLKVTTKQRLLSVALNDDS